VTPQPLKVPTTWQWVMLQNVIYREDHCSAVNIFRKPIAFLTKSINKFDLGNRSQMTIVTKPAGHQKEKKIQSPTFLQYFLVMLLLCKHLMITPV